MPSSPDSLLVVGGSGYLGRELVRQALALGLRVTATHFSGGPGEAGATWIPLDVRDEAAVERALELGVADADAVRLILEHRREDPVGLFSLDGRPHLKLVGVPSPDLSAYASLAPGVAP